jgi:beta-glucosidase
VAEEVVADVEALLQALTIEEMAALTAGDDFFSTVAVDRLGIQKIHLTDGPNGARGLSFPGLGGPAATCIPCGSAIGASWNLALAAELGELLARETLDRGCRGLLAPTVNLHRSPLAGRNFECYSEDPLLSGRLAVGYIRGLQSLGVFATVKHFVANDAEFERGTINSIVDERSLRELYLLPFELAVRDGGALALMTSYNRLNGRWLTEQPEFLTALLRDEWGFQGLVMTDWYATANTVTSMGAGLSLEMPGPGRALGTEVLAAIEDGRVDKADLEKAVGDYLRALDFIGALDSPPPPNDPQPPTPEVLDLLRRASAETMVLFTNDGTLPLEPASLSRVAVIGAHATRPRIHGGGSAAVIPHRLESILDTLAVALGDDVEITYARGCEPDMSPLVLGNGALHAPAGFEVDLYAGLEFQGDVIQRKTIDDLRMFVLNSMAQGWPDGEWSARVRGTVVPADSGVFQLAMAQAGKARLMINGALVLDGFTTAPPLGGTDFFGQASVDMLGEVTLEAGVPVEVVVEYARTAGSMGGVRVGFRTIAADELIERAVAAAASTEVALVFVGTSEEWETETRDRESMNLPGRQEELIRRVAAVNPRTVVVVNAGAPVDLSWAGEVAAVVQTWFGGQEMPAAIADVLVGLAEPGGRLATTIPMRLEHSPSHDNFPGENGDLRYGEGLFMGYRGFDHRCIEPRFAFGHGLSYTTFALGVPTLSADVFEPGGQLDISVPVTNTGSRAGSQVVQCYVAPINPRLPRPPKELKAFGKVFLEPGETAQVEMALDDRSFAYWDSGDPDWQEVSGRSHIMFITDHSERAQRRQAGWQVDPGEYDVLIGTGSDEITSSRSVSILSPRGDGPAQIDD